VDLQRDAARLASIATVFVWVGWLAVLYAFIAGLFWWIDLAGRPAFNFLEAFAISAAAIGVPLFLALIVAALGHALRLLAAYVARSAV
jgi:Kef-type K+ transport system membrane component KefB